MNLGTAISIATTAATAKRAWDRAQPTLNRRYGPLALKWWLVLGVAGVTGVYLYQNRDRNFFTSKEDFVRRLWNALGSTSLSAESKKLLIAQAALESGWGKASAARKGFGYWNVTAGTTWSGPTVWAWDNECYIWGYVCRPKLQRFRKYENDAEAVMDFLRFLGTVRYQRSLAALKAGRLSEYADALRDEGFYTASLNHYTTGMKGAMSVIDKVIASAPRIA